VEISETSTPPTRQPAPDRDIVRPRSPLFDLLETLLLAIVLFIGINTVSARIRVDGSSMEPTLVDKEFVLVNRMAYQIGDVTYGDVVVFSLPNDPDKEYVKRVIGLPGDRVEVDNLEVRVNGRALTEDYIAARPMYTGAWDVPEGSLFVLGDNRNNSTDSHVWGPVSMEHLVGKAILIYWPLQKVGVVH
jgi:signal peptidase I